MNKNKLKKLVIFISGRGSNMQHIIEETRQGILKGKAEVVMVFSDRPCAPGLEIAKQYNIPVASLSPEGMTREEFFEKVDGLLQKVNFDLLVLAGFMRILPPSFVRKYKGKIINIHPADTRKHQGLRAYEWAFENQLDKTYITIHFVDEGVDTGKIIAQAPVDLRDVSSLKEVEERGLQVEHKLYPETISQLIQNKII